MTVLGIIVLCSAVVTALAAAHVARCGRRARSDDDREFRVASYRMSAILAAVAIVLAGAGLELLHG